MRSIALLISTFCVLPGLAAAADADTAKQGELHCESPSTPGDYRNIECPLNASGTPQRFRFKANFSGGHDDTMASMEATLDGSPLACEKGSKTSLQGEDGDVSLECRFSLKEKAGTKHVFAAALTWRHAQYTDFELHPE